MGASHSANHARPLDENTADRKPQDSVNFRGPTALGQLPGIMVGFHHHRVPPVRLNRI